MRLVARRTIVFDGAVSLHSLIQQSLQFVDQRYTLLPNATREHSFGTDVPAR
jgi:hypothetical protein